MYMCVIIPCSTSLNILLSLPVVLSFCCSVFLLFFCLSSLLLLCLSIVWSLCPSVLSFYRSVLLSVCLTFCPCVILSFCCFVFLPYCPFCLSVLMSLCHSFFLSVHLRLYFLPSSSTSAMMASSASFLTLSPIICRISFTVSDWTTPSWQNPLKHFIKTEK